MELILPEEATPEILEVLGMMNFRTCPIAHLYRKAGHKIPTKVESEQAFVLFKLLKIAIQHGEKWRDVFGDELDEVIKKIKETEAT